VINLLSLLFLLWEMQPSKIIEDFTIAQKDSRPVLTVTELASCQIKSCGICGGLNDIGAGFFLSTSISPANCHSTVAGIAQSV
jgi:hypothetical protein